MHAFKVAADSREPERKKQKKWPPEMRDFEEIMTSAYKIILFKSVKG